MEAIQETNFNFAHQTGFYRGKVREVYFFGHRLAMIASDRISAFDVVLPRAIPFKGQVLNQIAAHFLCATADIVPNWLLKSPHPNLSIGLKCEPFAIELVVRGYLAGHAWREYQAGKRSICGVPLPDGLRENDQLPSPIITPTTKALHGHDQDISKEQILAQGIVSPQDYSVIEDYALALFDKGTQMAAQQGLILVDTKYEFGKYEDKIYLIDEVHTPDSSRYFYSEGYQERQQKGEKQKQLSKEFVRQWLISKNFQGKEGQNVPDMDEDLVLHISQRYVELYEKITGQKFVPQNYQNTLVEIENQINDYFGANSE